MATARSHRLRRPSLRRGRNHSGNQKAMISLRPIDHHDWQFLYDLLAERPKEANISHQSMPSLEAHISFITSNPYQSWYIIENEHSRLGSIYLTNQDEIGIFILKSNQNQGIAPKAIELLMQAHPKPRYLANIAPQNANSMKLFNKLGFNLCQHTLELKA
jgi:RimJ/RimL family protein N-acetyltransferase